MLQLEAAYATTIRVIADWRKRLLFARPQSLTQRLLSYSLPVLWVLAITVGAAAVAS